MKTIIKVLLLSGILAPSFLSAQDAKWLAKQPAFGRIKPIIHTNDRWESEKGNIWIGVSFLYEKVGKKNPKYYGAVPCIAGTMQTWHDELEDAAHNQMVEYMTRSGEVFWVPVGGAEGISGGHVPTCESAKEIRLYDKNGKILCDFKADPAAVPPRWEPFMSVDGELTFTRISGGEKDTWEFDHTIWPGARLSGDNGVTWVPFKGIVTDHPVVPIPPELMEKEQILVEVFVSKNMAIEVTRYLICPKPGMRGVRAP